MIYQWQGLLDPSNPLNNAIGSKPRRIRGTEVSDSGPQAVSRVLRERGIEPIRITQYRRPAWLERFLPIKTEHQLAFFESMNFMDVVPMPRAIALCAQRCLDQRYATALAAIARDTELGLPLHEAMERRPLEFNPLQVAMVRAGTAAARLPETYKHLGFLLQNKYNTVAAVRSALLGPLLLLVASAFVVVFMLMWFVPQMRLVLDYLHQPIPPATAIVLWLSTLAMSPLVWLAVLLSTLASVAGGWYILQISRARLWLEQRLAKAPVFGALADKVVTARVARVLAVVLRALGTTRAVKLLIPLAITLRHRLALEQIAADCTAGVPLDEAFARVGAFDPMLTQYLTSGKAGAKQAEACEKVATFLEHEVARKTADLTAQIEPAITIVITTVFTVLVLVLYQPFLTVMQSLGSLQ